MVTSAYLDSQKLNIITNIKLANVNKKLSDVNATDSMISIFGSNITREISSQAQACNATSSNIENNEDINTAEACATINTEVANLQGLTNWAGAAQQDIGNTKGIQSSSVTALGEAVGSALQYAATTISTVAQRANEALTQLQKVQESKTPEKTSEADSSKSPDKVNNTTEENPSAIINQTQENLKSLSQNTPATTAAASGASDIATNKEPVAATEAATEKKVASSETNTAKKADYKIATAATTDKTAEAVNTPSIGTSTVAAAETNIKTTTEKPSVNIAA